MSMAEEMYGGYDIPAYVGNEEHWKEGIHYDQEERMHFIENMSDSHLLATIKYFLNHDTRPLIKEAKRRKLKIS